MARTNVFVVGLYAVAYVYMGAKNQAALLRNYERVVEELNFQFEQVDESLPRVATESEPPA